MVELWLYILKTFSEHTIVEKICKGCFLTLPYAEVKIFFLAAISKIPGDNWSKSSFGAQPWVFCVLQEEDVVVKRILLLDEMVGQITGLNPAMKTDILSRTTH